MNVELPDNSMFPWNHMVEMTDAENRGVGVSLGAVHEQLCVVADLLRAQISAATCTRCGAVADDTDKHRRWHLSLEATTDGIGL